jgi:hypothetical protein
MHGAVPPFPHYVFMAWCSVKHRNNFTFTFTSKFRFPNNINIDTKQKSQVKSDVKSAIREQKREKIFFAINLKCTVQLS